jgi:hypothetical protein
VDEEQPGAITPDSKTLKWAIIASRLLALPIVLEMLIVGGGMVYAVMEGPRAFTGYAALILAFMVVAGLHAVPAVACGVVGWRMARRRNLGEVPRTSTIWGAIFGSLYFAAPLLILLIDPTEPEVWLWVGFLSLFTWPALLFAILCIRLRQRAPARDVQP